MAPNPEVRLMRLSAFRNNIIQRKSEMNANEALDAIKSRLDQSIAEHKTWIDGWAFNVLTILSLVFSAFSSLYSSGALEGYKWVAPTLAALAGLAIGVERTLGLGTRWRFHTELKNGYISLKDMIDFYHLLPAVEQDKYLKDIWNALYALRSREAAIPNSGSSI
jgi:hypothetical protein